MNSLESRMERMEAELRRGTVQLVTLTLLETPRYGYDLVRLLAEAGFDVEEGTLYPILRRMEQQGVLESTWNTEGSRPRKYYRLSDDGLNHKTALVAAWRRVRDATDAWWQGDKDMRNAAHAAKYEENLGYLLAALRKDFNAPKAKFVCASLGQTDESDKESGHGKILHAMKNFAASSDDIGFVYAKPLLGGPGSSSGHYSGNAQTYMNVGLALGEKMAELIKK